MSPDGKHTQRVGFVLTRPLHTPCRSCRTRTQHKTYLLRDPSHDFFFALESGSKCSFNWYEGNTGVNTADRFDHYPF